ncbi:MAG: hypothetical protein ABW277_01390 [Longimicrobiaceae bacterium]
MRPLSLVLVPALALAAACAPATSADPSAGAGTENRRSDFNALSRQEIAESDAGTAYDLVRARRPRWLSSGLATASRNSSRDPVVVYVNRTRMGGPDALRTISASGVGSMRFYEPTSANLEFGNGHLGGVIQVTPISATAAQP